jgi:hypothetical protein
MLGQRYSRLDFDIPDGNWGLDSVANINTLLHLGSQCATEQLPKLRDTFFAQTSEPYRPSET